MTNPRHRYPSFEEMEAYLQTCAHKHGERAVLAVEGYSPQKRPVYSITLTDPQIPAEQKQNVLLTCVHSTERSAVAVLFAVMDWLLSSEPSAREVMRRQSIVCMPMINPDGYVGGKLDPDHKSRDGALYSQWTAAGVARPDHFPEAAALQRVIDRSKPDMYADVHGISLDFEHQLMLESSAASPSRTASRPYHQQIARLMDEAALAGGFPSDFQEDDREVLYWDPKLDDIKAKLWTGRGRWSPGLYAYNRYHTLHVIMEITWQRSGLLRFQRLLRIGNETWDGEPCPGYPNRIVAAFGATGMYQTIAAYGQDAAAQRRSRAEICSKHHQTATAILDPPMTGKAAAVFTVSNDARREWLNSNPGLKNFVAALERHPRVNARYMREFMAGWPKGQNYPEACLFARHGGDVGDTGRADEPMRNGLALRMRIPYSKADIREIRLNGHPLPASAADGYALWRARGFTFIQANIPPAKSQAETLWILTCAYDPGEYRPQWESWAGITAEDETDDTRMKRTGH